MRRHKTCFLGLGLVAAALAAGDAVGRESMIHLNQMVSALSSHEANRRVNGR